MLYMFSLNLRNFEALPMLFSTMGAFMGSLWGPLFYIMMKKSRNTVTRLLFQPRLLRSVFYLLFTCLLSMDFAALPRAEDCLWCSLLDRTRAAAKSLGTA